MEAGMTTSNHNHHHHHDHHTTESVVQKTQTHHEAPHMSHHSMTFHLWSEASRLLFESWSLNTAQDLAVAMLVSTALSFIYEGSKFYYHIGRILRHKKAPSRWDGSRLAHYVSRLWKALAYSVHFAIGYVLMLFAMTFNVWLMACVCIGSGISYFFLVPTIIHVLRRSWDVECSNTRDNIVKVSRRTFRVKGEHQREECDAKVMESSESETLLDSKTSSEWPDLETVI